MCIYQYPSKEYFEEEYIKKGKTRNQLAEENNVTVATIKTHLYEKRIIKPPLIDKEKLTELYVDEQKTMKEIAAEINHDRNAVSRALKKYGIQKQNNYVQYDDALDDEWIDLYLTNQCSTSQIGEMYGVSHGTVKKHLLRSGIDIRSYSEAQRAFQGKQKLSSDLDDYDIMYNLYVTQKLDLKVIGERYSCTAKAVRDKLTSLKIPIRTLTETRLGRYTGEAHPNWKGGITKLSARLREYFNDWLAPMVRLRDNYQCQLCGCGSNLHVHHIKKFSDILHDVVSEHPEYDPTININELYEIAKNDQRFLNTDNLITYCRDCHLYKIHKFQRTTSSQAS